MASTNTEKVISLDSRRGGLFSERAPRIEPSKDAAEWWRRVEARGAAFLLHFLILLLLILGATWHEPAPPPPPIPVEVVMTPPPTPKARPIQAPKPPPPAAKPAPAPMNLESGGNPDLLAGRPAEKAAPKQGGEIAKPVPPNVAPRAAEIQSPKLAAVTKDVPEPKPAQPAPQSQYQTPFLVRNAEQKAPQQQASLPQRQGTPILSYPPGAPDSSAASAPDFDQSGRVGEGGGNRYLNAMRDLILSNLIYPAAAQGATGVARYVMLVSRGGYLIALHLVDSSGSTALDRAGTDAIQNSAPFQPLPQDVPGNQVAIRVQLYIGPK
ncbi:MAG TPA: TonB family protein [Alphaproteobacteria bacterium]|nr:TonB family protein [Alphaproteobacteria bacterium]